MFDFVADRCAKFGVGRFLFFPMADTAVEKVRAVADVALVLVRPFHKTKVGVCGFHDLILVAWLGFGNDSSQVRMLELAVRTFLAIEFEPCLSEIFEEVADFFGHGFFVGWR